MGDTQAKRREERARLMKSIEELVKRTCASMSRETDFQNAQKFYHPRKLPPTTYHLPPMATYVYLKGDTILKGLVKAKPAQGSFYDFLGK